MTKCPVCGVGGNCYEHEHQENAPKTKNYDYLVFIGRFEPWTYGHFHVVTEALKQTEKLIIAVGSCNLVRDQRNPLTFQERVLMLKQCGIPEINIAILDKRILFVPLDDMDYMHQQWIEHVQEQVNTAIEQDGFSKRTDISNRKKQAGPKIGLVGWSKDNSSYYLNMFPQWTKGGGVSITPKHLINATEVRESMFKGPSHFEAIVDSYTTKPVADLLRLFMTSSVYERIKKEYEWAESYKQLWSKAPYPVIFQTVDAVVVRSGHVLLVKRKAFPGRGLWALPGGYVNPDEYLLDAAIRELVEETRLGMLKLGDIPFTAEEIFGGDKQDNLSKVKALLKNHLVSSQTFDNPHRSHRGRVITNAFLFQLPDGPLPPVKGSDDAEKAAFVPISELKADELFEDHYGVLMASLAKL